MTQMIWQTSGGASRQDRAIGEATGENSSRWVRWWQCLKGLGRKQRNLRLLETLSLGDRRFVAVIEYEQMQFLIGGTSTALVLLTCLKAASESMTDGPQPVEPISRERRN